MSYLAENLAMFMAEAVDRNGKKDPSLNMKHPSDMVKKYKNQENEAKKDYESRLNRTITKLQTSDAAPQGVRYAATRNGAKDVLKHKTNAVTYNNSTKELNGVLAGAKAAEREKKKCHNESALFNDPIWDEL